MTYEEILADLGRRLNLPLAPDQNNTCKLQLEEGLILYLEPTEESDELIIGILLGTVAPGKGAERMFQALLVENGRHRPFLGNFAYSRAIDQLLLSERAPMKYIDGEMTLNLLLPLVEEARRWRGAIQSGILPTG